MELKDKSDRIIADQNEQIDILRIERNTLQEEMADMDVKKSIEN